MGRGGIKKLIKFTFIPEKALENARLMRPSSDDDDADAGDDGDDDDDAKGSWASKTLI